MRPASKLAFIVASLVILGVGLGLVLDRLRDDPPSDATSAVPSSESGLPAVDPAVASATQDYLAGDASLLLELHAAANALASSPSDERCSHLTKHLNEEVAPDRALGMAGGVPDSPLATAFMAERSLLGQALTSCGEDGTESPAFPRLSRRLGDVAEIIDRRLTELEHAA